MPATRLVKALRPAHRDSLSRVPSFSGSSTGAAAQASARRGQKTTEQRRRSAGQEMSALMFLNPACGGSCRLQDRLAAGFIVTGRPWRKRKDGLRMARDRQNAENSLYRAISVPSRPRRPRARRLVSWRTGVHHPRRSGFAVRRECGDPNGALARHDERCRSLAGDSADRRGMGAAASASLRQLCNSPRFPHRQARRAARILPAAHLTVWVITGA